MAIFVFCFSFLVVVLEPKSASPLHAEEYAYDLAFTKLLETIFAGVAVLTACNNLEIRRCCNDSRYRPPLAFCDFVT